MEYFFEYSIGPYKIRNKVKNAYLLLKSVSIIYTITG